MYWREIKELFRKSLHNYYNFQKKYKRRKRRERELCYIWFGSGVGTSSWAVLIHINVIILLARLLKSPHITSTQESDHTSNPIILIFMKNATGGFTENNKKNLGGFRLK